MNGFAVIFLALTSAFAQHSYTPIEVTDSESSSGESLTPGLRAGADYRTSTDEILWEIPNVTFSGGTNRARYLQIRGTGETSVYETTPSHSVSVFFEDIDLTGITATLPQGLAPNQSLLRGPQSSLYGGFASGGVLSLAAPTPDSPSQAQLTYQSRATLDLGADIRLSKNHRVSVFHHRSDGHYQNLVSPDGGNRQNEYYVSLNNRFWNTERLRLSSHHLFVHTQNAYDVWTFDNSLTTLSDQPGVDAQQVHGHSLRIETRLTPRLSAHSISSVTVSRSIYSYDADWGHRSFWQALPGWHQDYDYFDESFRERVAWHQRIYLQSPLFKLGFHGYGLQEDSLIQAFKNKNLRRSTAGDYNSASGAVFFESDHALSATHSLFAGGRLERQKQTFEDSLSSMYKNWDSPSSAQLGWRWQVEHASIQLAHTRGFKSGGFNVDDILVEGQQTYQPENISHWEAQTTWNTSAASRWSLNVFLTRTRDKQIRESRQDDPSDPSSYTYFTGNASQTTAHGWEVQWDGRYSAWSWQLQGGFLNHRFDDYFFEGGSREGRDVAHAPRWSMSAAATYRMNSHWSFFTSVTGRDRFYFSNTHEQRSKAAALLNIGGRFRKGAWTYSAWIKNLMASRAQTRGFFFANEPPDWTPKLYTQREPPPTLGLAVNYRF